MSNMPDPLAQMRETPALLHLACACMAVSNMGQEPDYERMRFTLEGWRKYSTDFCNQLSLSSAVCQMAEQYMEAEEHQDIFEQEAQAWLDRFQESTWIAAGTDYPRMREIYTQMRRYVDGT